MDGQKLSKKDRSVGKRIKYFRKNAKLTQEQLAEKIHISTTHIGLVETGKRRMSLKTLQKIANVLEIKVKDLISF